MTSKLVVWCWTSTRKSISVFYRRPSFKNVRLTVLAEIPKTNVLLFAKGMWTAIYHLKIGSCMLNSQTKLNFCILYVHIVQVCRTEYARWIVKEKVVMFTNNKWTAKYDFKFGFYLLNNPSHPNRWVLAPASPKQNRILEILKSTQELLRNRNRNDTIPVRDSNSDCKFGISVVEYPCIQFLPFRKITITPNENVQ